MVLPQVVGVPLFLDLFADLVWTFPDVILLFRAFSASNDEGFP